MLCRKSNDLLRAYSLSYYPCNGYSNQRITDFPTTFQPKDFEKKWCKIWQSNGYFNRKDNTKDLNMILPPPNVTGVLHLGHALTATIQDVLARWHRMNGGSVVWIPGLDHAGIATQVVVEKHLKYTKNLSKCDMTKADFVSAIWNWKNENGSIIQDQLRALGATLDWSREYFTMDKHLNTAVTEAFVLLNARNMLYRDQAIINWSPALNSTISDIEVTQLGVVGKTQLDIPGYTRKVTFGQIVEIAYELPYSNEELIVATTRPETIFGDVALAVHPDDARFNQYIGQYALHPMRQTEIPIIGDTSVDRNFGTGVLKITPAHNHLDYTIAKNHGLNPISVIDEKGTMTEAAKCYKGLPRFIARQKVMDELSNQNMLRNVKDHNMTVPICSRTGDVIEYVLKEQWFVKCKDMADRARMAVKDGSLKINPEHYTNVWFDWLGNIRDWCVSRQLEWGHRIPAYKAEIENNVEWIIARSKEEAELIAFNKFRTKVMLQQDNDVLDTWFSSALLPFSIMGWPNWNEDMQTHYPLTLLETGNDILCFWVARMVMLGLELTGQLPFQEVLLHGVLCDINGKKMSKSSGNVISPESVIHGITLEELNAQTNKRYYNGALKKSELKRTLAMNSALFPDGILQCGTDTLRMTLCARDIKNDHITFDVAQCKINKAFFNKLLNASKYVLLTIDPEKYEVPKVLSTIDRWILSRLSFMISTVNEAFEQKNFHHAVAAIKQFIHLEFCDFYLEGTKFGIKDGGEDIVSSHSYTLLKCLEISLRILAPIAPFISDELYNRLSMKLPTFLSITSLLEAPYPKSNEFIELRNHYLEEYMNELINLTLGIRSLTALISKRLYPEVHIVVKDDKYLEFSKCNINMIKAGGKIWNIHIFSEDDYTEPESSLHDDSNCYFSLYLLTQDPQIMDQVKKKLEKSQNKNWINVESKTEQLHN